jgi:hypothetical protein
MAGGGRIIVSQYVVRQRPSGVGLGGQSWISRLLAQMFARRPRRPATDRLSNYLLRDAGLERVGGVVRRRAR